MQKNINKQISPEGNPSLLLNIILNFILSIKRWDV